MSINRLIALSILVLWLIGSGPAAPRMETLAAPRPPEPSVGCAACIVVDDNGEVLWARAPHARRSIASTTKMVTALVVRRHADLADEVTVSQAAAAIPEGRLSLQAGETFNVKELLYGLLLNSSNDAAVALAEHAAGSVDGFVALMNETAGRLGATGSHFTTPHGLDAADHYSTAADLALLGAAVLRDPVLGDIVADAAATIEGSNRTVQLDNTNLLLESYAGAVGIKTGFTASAGNVLVAAAESKGRTIIAVTLGSADTFEDARRLLDYGFAVLRRGIVLRAGTPVGGIVFDTLGASGIVAERTLRGLTDPAAVELAFEPLTDLRAPLQDGASVGTITVSTQERTVATVGAVAAADVDDAAAEGWAAEALQTLIRGAAAVLPGED